MTQPAPPPATPAPLRQQWPLTTEAMNFYEVDTNLQRFLERAGLMIKGDHRFSLEGPMHALGAWVGDVLEKQAVYSDRHAPPRLVGSLARPGVPGERINAVVFNPLYLAAQEEVYRRGVIGKAYHHGRPRPHMASFAMGYLLSQSDISTHCPVTLTGAVAYVLNRYAPPKIRGEYLYDLIRIDGKAKTGGTWATERHSGTNAGATTCVAKKMEDGSFRLSGQKWFASNAASNLAIALARPEGAPEGNKGAGLYLIPDVVEGKPNTYKIEAVKEKLGTRGLATAEIDLNDCYAIEIAPPPHGLRVMMEALEYSRVHNAMSAAGVTHRLYREALCWATHRSPFGAPLIEKPIIQDELIDFAAEWMASSALAFHTAGCYSDVDEKKGGEAERNWMRLATAAAKWRTAESAVQMANALVELIGGNGYTTDFPAERLLRDAKVLQVWEGPKQVQALELMRVILGPDKDVNAAEKTFTAMADNLPDCVADLRRAVTRELRDLRKNIRFVKANPQTAEQAAVVLLKQFSDVLALTLLADEAAWEIEHKGDDMKLLVARHFHEKTFGERHAVPFTPGELQRNFNRLVAVPPPAPAPYYPWPLPPRPKP